MATFNAGSIEATLDLDRSPFTRGIELARQQGRRFAQERYQARLDLDTAAVNAKIVALEAQLAAIDGRHVEPRIDVDVARQIAELAGLDAALDRIDGRRVSPDMGGGTQEVTAFASATASAGGGLSSLIGLGVALGPALIPGIAGATAALGGMVAMLGAAGGAGGVFGVGLVGNIARVVGAQKDLKTTSDQATAAAKAQEAAQERLHNALNGVATASRAAGDARRNAARSEAQAEESVASARRNAAYSTQQAEQSLASAQDGVRRAQQDLNQARAEATQRLQEMRDQLAGAELNEEGSELAVRAARQRLQEVMRDPRSTKLQRDEADLAYRRALLQMKEARKANDDLQSSVKKAQRAGVNGDAAVKAAKDRLNQSRKTETSAEQNLARVRAQGAQQVQDAEKNLAQTRADNARAIQAADQRVSEAQRDVAAAQRSAAEASAALAEANKTQADAMEKLSGPAAVFVKALTAAKGAWNDFLDATESDTLGVATQGIGLFVKYLPELVPIVHAVTPVISGLLDELDRWAGSGGMDAIVGFLTTYGPPAIEGFGHIIGNLSVLVGNLMDAFAPMGLAILDWLMRVTDGWKDWSRTLDTNKGFQNFLSYVTENGPLFVGFLDAAWDALINIGRALAPAAGPILMTLTWGLRQIADMDPNQLGAVAGGIELVVGAILLATSGGTNPLGWLMVLSGTTLGLSNLAGQSDETKGRLDKLGGVVKDVVGWLGDKWDAMWRRTLRPDLMQIRDVLLHEFLPAWDAFWPVIRPIIHFFADILVAVVENALDGVLRIVRGGFRILSGVMNIFSGLLTGHWDRMWKGIKQVAGGALDIVKGMFQLSLAGTMLTIVRTVVGKIGDSWGRIKQIFAGPVNWVIDNVFNRLIAAVNGVSGMLGHGNILKPMGHVDLTGTYSSAAGGGGGSARRNHEGRLGPIRAASGTVLPGFTPGVDTLHYRAPNGPDLHLGGGEAVMVPEWTRAVGGPKAVARMNAEAKAMRFAGGGVVWPTVGRRISTYAGHDGVDINQPPGPDFGAPIYAYRAGRITYTGWGRGYGDAVFEKGNVGPEVVYGHMSKVLAHVGQLVRAGQIIGRVGATGHASGPHLHFGVPGGTYAGALALLHGATHVAGGASGGGAVGAGFNPLAMIGRALGRIRGVADHAPGGRFGHMLADGLVGTIGRLARSWAGRAVGTVTAAAGQVIGANSAKSYAQRMLHNYGWSAVQWPALNALWEQESGWNPRADNPTSSAYGIPQALPGAKMASAGADWRTNAATQVRWGLGYIKDRYGSPTAAMAHERNRGWYDNGGVVPPGITTVVNESRKPEALLNNDQWRLARRAMGVDRPNGSADGWSRGDIERLIEAVAAANPVVVPQSDNTKELIDLLGFELRVQGRGPR